MFEEIKKFKTFLKEDVEKTNKEFKIEVLLVISNATEKMQTEILSNIRAIAGVTRIHLEGEAIKRSHYYISRCTLKIDLYPYGMLPLEDVFQVIRKSVLDIDGVRRFTYISKPERI